MLPTGQQNVRDVVRPRTCPLSSLSGTINIRKGAHLDISAMTYVYHKPEIEQGCVLRCDIKFEPDPYGTRAAPTPGRSVVSRQEFQRDIQCRRGRPPRGKGQCQSGVQCNLGSFLRIKDIAG